MLNHHTHLTDPIWEKKTNAFNMSMDSPSRQLNFTVRVSHRCIITVEVCGRSLHRPSLGVPTVEYTWFSEFGCSRHRVWALPPSLALLNGDDLYLNAYVCWVVSIVRHSVFYAQPRARTHELDLAETGSDIVEAGCCNTSQH